MTGDLIWVFHSENARFAGGTFSDQKVAEEWILKHSLTGLLTAYPINCGVFDWAVENEYFNPKKDLHKTPNFIGGFTSASQEHYHYENGKIA